MKRHATLLVLACLASAGCSSWLDLGSNQSSDTPFAPEPGGVTPEQAVLCPPGSATKEALVAEPDVFVMGFTHDEQYVWYQTEPMGSTPTETIVKRVPIGGGAAEEVARSARSSGIMAAGDFVYWSAPRGDSTGDDLFRLPKKGGQPEVVTRDKDNPFGHFARDAQDNLYFTNYASYLGAGAAKLVKLAPDGTRSVLVSEGKDDVGGFAVTKDAVFWSTIPRVGAGGVESDAVIRASELSATGPSRTVYGPVAKSAVGQIAADETTLFFGADRTVQSVPKAGGSATSFAIDQAYPLRIVVDGGVVYWLNSGFSNGEPEGPRLGSVVRKPAAGGAEEVLTDDVKLPKHLEVSRCQVLWDSQVGHGTAIYRLSRAGAGRK